MNLKKKLYLAVFVVIAVILYFSHDSIISTYISIAEKSSLPHYLKAQKITQREYDAVVSESRVLINKDTDAIPGMSAYLDAHGLRDIQRPEIIADDPAGMYYLQDTLQFSLDSFMIYAFPVSLTKDPIYMVSNDKVSQGGSPNYDSRWEPTGGLACFSCGCECYMNKQLKIANGELYVSVIGQDFAIRPERQGIYVYRKQTSTWTRLTPKIDGDFKVANKGCNIYYVINSQPYILNACIN